MHHAALKLTATFVGIALMGATPAIAAPVPADGDPVLYWSQVLSTGLAGSPTVTSRGFAMVEVALHDAVNATQGNPNHSYLGAVPNPGGDTRAAASVAARNVLVHLNPAKTAEFDAALTASLALIPDGAAKANGIATGTAIAAAAIANRADDGSTATVPYSPSGQPGGWAPTPPADAPAALPQWAHVDPWLMSAVDQFRPGPPPALSSNEYAAAYQQVKEIGSATSASRTADQTESALFWAGAAGTGPWVQAAIAAASDKQLSTLENARLFARLAIGIADATIATWDAKYEHDYWRPVTAIRAGDLDGNPLTDGDGGWTPLIVTPPHPSYISAHSAVAGAAATILEGALGDAFDFCLTAGANERCWGSFSGAATDAMNSRLWGGIHWSFDNEAGLLTGQQVGRFVLGQNIFNAVPEPATWAMMITGFFFIGSTLRRRATTPRPGVAR